MPTPLREETWPGVPPRLRGSLKLDDARLLGSARNPFAGLGVLVSWPAGVPSDMERVMAEKRPILRFRWWPRGCTRMDDVIH